jgi:hypothetical protein
VYVGYDVEMELGNVIGEAYETALGTVPMVVVVNGAAETDVEYGNVLE